MLASGWEDVAELHETSGPEPAMPQAGSPAKAMRSDPATDSAAIQAAELWLAQPRAWLRPLPRVLRLAYDADTRAQRSRIGCRIGLIGAAVGLGFYPTLASVAPGEVHDLNRLFVGIAFPVTVLSALLVLFDLRPFWREIVLAVPSLVSASVITCLFVRSGEPVSGLFATGMILLMLFAAVTLQLRFDIAVPVVAAILGLLAYGVQRAPELIDTYRQGIDSIGAGCAAYLLLANWRNQAEQARSYVLTLRERQLRQALASQNLALNELAWSDSLTGLANRRAYDAWLLASWEKARAIGDTIGIIMIDVDHFKAFNDRYGHPAGDLCLRQVADCLREQLRDTTDLVARVGGEEFAVILPRATPATCGHVALRLRAAVAGLNVPHKVTVSCGYATGAGLPETLCEMADAALYRAKQNGRNCVSS